MELFHFVGRAEPRDNGRNFELLCKVLGTECVSHAPHDGTWGRHQFQTNPEGTLKAETYVVPSVTCYADIPIESLRIHVKKYGLFGLSFSRHLLAKYGARPVMYVPMRSDDWESPYGVTLLNDIEAIFRGYENHVVGTFSENSDVRSRTLCTIPASATEAIDALKGVFEKDFISFIKPFNSYLDENDPHNYYMEREWRKFGNLKFHSADVVTIIVATGYKEKLISEFPYYKGRVVEVEF